MIPRAVRQPAIWLAAALVAILFDVFALGSTILPHTIQGITPSGPYRYVGYRPPQPHGISVDPAGAYEMEWPWAAFFVRSVREGSLPLWNPYQGLGQPQLADYAPAILFPLNWLRLVLPRTWWDLLSFVDWFIAAYFLSRFGRLIGFGRWGSLAAGLALFAAGFFPAYLSNRTIIATVASFAFLLYSIERALRDADWRWRPLYLALGTFGVATAGHPAPAVFGLALSVAYTVIRLLLARGPWLAGMGRVFPSMLAGGLLAAPLLVSFAELALRDGLPTHTPGRGLEHFAWQALPMTVFPFLYGPMNDTIWGAINAHVTWIPASVMCLAFFGLFSLPRRSALIALVAPAAIVAAKNFGVPLINDLGRLPPLDRMTMDYGMGYVQLAVCAMAGAGVAFILRRPISQWRAPAVVWAIYVAVMLSIGASTFDEAGSQFTSVPWRIVHHSAALGAGLFWAVAFPCSLAVAKWRYPDRPRIVTLLILAGLGLPAAAYFPNGSPESFVIFQVAAAGTFAVGVFVALLWGRRVNERAAVLAPLVVVAAMVAIVAWYWPRFPDRHDPLAPAPFVEYLSRQPNAPRLHPLDGALNPNFGSAVALSSMTNLDTLITKQGAAFINTFLDRGVYPSRFFGLNAMRDPALPDPLGEFWAHRRYWDLVGVRFVLTNGRNPNESRSREHPNPGEDLEFVLHDWSRVSIYRNRSAADRAFLAPVAVPVGDPETAMARLKDAPDPQRTAFIEGGACAGNPAHSGPPGRLVDLRLSANYVELEYDAKTAGVLTLTDAHARGWRVAVDGREVPLLRVDGAFRGACLDSPGLHAVTFWYRPPSWAFSLTLCAIGGSGLLALHWVSRRRRRPPTNSRSIESAAVSR